MARYARRGHCRARSFLYRVQARRDSSNSASQPRIKRAGQLQALRANGECCGGSWPSAMLLAPPAAPAAARAACAPSRRRRACVCAASTADAAAAGLLPADPSSHFPPLQLGALRLRSAAILSPMESVSDVGFRQLCFAQGAAFTWCAQPPHLALMHGLSERACARQDRDGARERRGAQQRLVAGHDRHIRRRHAHRCVSTHM